MENNEHVPEFFNVRAVNITKVNTEVDCDIIIAECDHSISRIDGQLAEGWGDELWRKDALRARGDYESKKTLALMKRESIEIRRKERVPPEDAFKARFMKAAQDLLPVDVYTLLFESARAKAEQ